MEHRRTASAEFPNDNPDLHEGALWIVSRPCAPARVLVPRPPSEPPFEPAEFDLPGPADDGTLDIDIDVELPDDAAQLEAAEPLVELASSESAPAEPAPVAPAVEPAPEADAADESQVAEDLFGVFVGALVRVAMDAGASRIAARLPGFLEEGAMSSEGLAPEVVEALGNRGFAELGGSALRASPACAATCSAWRQVLSGASDDLSACGTSTLDGWAAELLAAALGAPPDAVKKLRRELRRLGVAAFGIIAQAA